MAALSLEEATRARLEAIFREYYQDLYRYAYSKIGNAHDAEDIVQLVALNFSRIYSERHFESDEKLKHYLMSILDGKIKNYWRDTARKGAHVQTVDTLPERPTLTLEDEVFSRYDAELIRRCINELPERYGTYLRLALDPDSTPETIAEILGVKIDSLRSIASRARKLLKKACEAMEIEVGRDGKRK